MIDFESLSEAKARVLGYFRTQLGDWDLSPRGFVGKLAAVQTLVLYQVLRTARKVDLDAVPTRRTSTAGLDEWAENGVGLSNGAGGYGRKGASAATGGVGTFTGTPGTVYPALSTLTASDGTTKFELANGPITVGGGGTVSGTIRATTTGVAGNQPAAAVLTVDAVPIGGNASVTLSVGLTGGAESQSNDVVLERIQNRLRYPPKALTGPDLRSLAESVSGIGRAYCYPRRNGTGTWDLVLCQSSSGTGRAATSDQLAAVEDLIEESRNVTVEGARYLAPTLAVSGLALRLRVTPSASDYAFDWDSSAGTWTVDLVTVGPPYTIRLNTLAPTDLKAAIDAGSKPRIQVLTTGVVLPVELRCTAWSDGGGKTTLTIETAPTTNPTASDAVHAGGPAVATVAAAALALVDSLGPSRVSGYQDPMDAWDDTLRIDQLRRVALGALDGDGLTRMVIALPAAPTIDGLASDVRATDATASAPELLYARSIAVTP